MILSANEILKLYDKEFENFRKNNSGATKYEDTSLGIRAIGETHHAFSNHYELKSPQWSEALIRSEIAYFRNLKRSFRWNIRSDLNPPGLVDTLLTCGFSLTEEGSLMLFDLETSFSKRMAPQEISIREVGVEEIPAMMKVQKAVWKDHFDTEAFGETLKGRKLASSNFLRLFAAYSKNQVVSCAWMKTTAESVFVHLNGGSTLSEFRGKGIYSAMIEARAAVARELGKKFLLIEAGPMSRPIAEKQGFRRLCDVFEYVYDCNARAPDNR